jgi:hypothetical protein
MVLVLSATVGGASSNSYLTLSEAQAIIDSLMLNEEVTTWDDADVDVQNRALVTAAWRIDRERFFGNRTSNTQALQWPRVGVRKPDQYQPVYQAGYAFSIRADYYADDEIPDEVKKAQTILALYLVSEPDALNLGGLEQFKNVSIGPLSVTPMQPQNQRLLPPLVEQYLRGLKASTNAISIFRN